MATTRPAPSPRRHLIVVEAPRAAAVDALAERAERLGDCTLERRRDGSAALSLEYREPPPTSIRQTSVLSRILSTVEGWLRQQPVAVVTVWVDGRRFSLARRDVRRGPAPADAPLARERQADQDAAARTALS